ncbi:MAG: DUF6519 domain-containing protein [Chthoniobacterales bacterium]
MKGDFTRNTFDRFKHFSSVLMQQGRVTLDADYNEQSAILLHYMRTLARDLIGPYAAPVEHAGFELALDKDGGFSISRGRIYVDGILVENDSDCTYATQPDYELVKDKDIVLKESKDKNNHLIWAYLDVWERHITALEDDSIREAALGGPDTCSRSKVVWQVKVLGDFPQGSSNSEIERHCDGPLARLTTISKAKLAARVDPGHKETNPCITPPDSKYRGAENQLYRVEIHHGGEEGEATFKWSRNNASSATHWLGTQGHDVKVAGTRGFTAGDWLELTDDSLEFAGLPGALVKVAKVANGVLSVDPGTPETAIAWSQDRANPKVRQWNQVQRGDIELKDGAIVFKETSANAMGWIDLEDGIQVRFEPGGEYRSGDYWLFPARVATGKIEWPSLKKSGEEVGKPLPPMGIEHHYAPLGFMAWEGQNWHFKSCRCDFEPLSSCFARGSVAVGSHLLRTSDTIKPKAASPPAKPAKASRKKPAP